MSHPNAPNGPHDRDYSIIVWLVLLFVAAGLIAFAARACA